MPAKRTTKKTTTKTTRPAYVYKRSPLVLDDLPRPTTPGVDPNVPRRLGVARYIADLLCDESHIREYHQPAWTLKLAGGYKFEPDIERPPTSPVLPPGTNNNGNGNGDNNGNDNNNDNNKVVISETGGHYNILKLRSGRTVLRRQRW